jgi:hypothetical protein
MTAQAYRLKKAYLLSFNGRDVKQKKSQSEKF